MPDNETLFADLCEIKDSGKAEEMAAFNRQFILDNYSVEKMTNDYENAYKELLSKNPFRTNDVLISGYYGFKNTGDDSLLKSIVSNLKQAKNDVTITVLSRKPDETSALYGVESINRFNFCKIRSVMKNTRLLISGGGTLLQDETSIKSYKYYSTVIKTALHYGTKVMIYANGIGPLNNAKNIEDCKKLLEKVDVITLRDQNSLEELKAMGVKKEITVTADPAFALVCDDYKNKDNNYFIVSVRKWKHLQPDFAKSIASICSEVHKKHGLTPVLVPMQKRLDLELCTEIAQLCGGKVNNNFENAEQLLTYIKDSKFVMGMRLHALIYSLSMSVPVVPLSYDPKVDAIIDGWDCCKGFSAKDINIEEILDRIDFIVENREKISAEISEVTQIMKEKTNHDVKTAVELINF